MFYHRRCKVVVHEFKEGRITKATALKLFEDIEEEAYKKIPDAEPDGDITFAVVSALDEIKEVEANKSKKQIHLLVMDDGISYKIEGAFFDGRKAQELATRYNGEDDAEDGCGPYDVVSVEIEDAKDKEEVKTHWRSEIKRKNLPVMYGIGIEHKPHEFGMTHGAFMNIGECLAIDGEEGSCILRLN